MDQSQEPSINVFLENTINQLEQKKSQENKLLLSYKDMIYLIKYITETKNEQNNNQNTNSKIDEFNSNPTIDKVKEKFPDLNIIELILLIAVKNQNTFCMKNLCESLFKRSDLKIINIDINKIEKYIDANDWRFHINQFISYIDTKRAIKSEFARLNSEPSNFWTNDMSNIFYCVNKLSKDELIENSGIDNYNIAQQTLFEINKTKDLNNFIQIFKIFESKDITFNYEILNKLDPQLLISTNPTLVIKSELERLSINRFSNHDLKLIIEAIKMPNINLNETCNLGNNLSIKEQLIVELFINYNNTTSSRYNILFQNYKQLLSKIGFSLTEDEIRRINDSFNMPPNNESKNFLKDPNNIDIENWWIKENLHAEIYNFEHQPGSIINEDKIIDIFLKCLEIWNKPNRHDDGLMNKFLLVAYKAGSTKMLEAYFSEATKYNVKIDLTSIASGFYNILQEKNNFLNWVSSNILLTADANDAITVLVSEYNRIPPNPDIIQRSLNIIKNEGFLIMDETIDKYFLNPIEKSEFKCWITRNIAELDLLSIKNTKKNPNIKDIAIISELDHGNCPTANFINNKNISLIDFEQEKKDLIQTIFNLMDKAEDDYIKGSGKYKSLRNFDNNDLERLKSFVRDNTSVSNDLKNILINTDNNTLNEKDFKKNEYIEIKNLLNINNEPNLQQKLESSRDPNHYNSDYITRLTTNEFFFYTSKPMTHDEFNTLQTQIYNKAKELSSGVHLVLSSFALEENNNKFLNVTTFITCGEKPSVNFIIKNNTSWIDPQYNIVDNNDVSSLRTLDINTTPNTDDFKEIKIGTKGSIDLDYNNVFLCQTPHGTPFYTAIDICLDHYIGVGKANFLKVIQQNNLDVDNTLISHVLTSNSIEKIRKSCIGPNAIMHVDPFKSDSFGCKENVEQLKEITKDKVNFGLTYKEYNLKQCPIYSFDNIMRFSLSKALCQIDSSINVVDIKPFKVKIDNEDFKDFITNYLSVNNINCKTSNDGQELEISDEFFNSKTDNFNIGKFINDLLIIKDLYSANNNYSPSSP